MIAFCQGPDWQPRHSLKEPGTCGACGKPLEGRHRWFCPTPYGKAHSPGESCRANYAVNHFWDEARAEALRRTGGRCRKCGEHAEEVNHIVPRSGGGYGPGCHHHQDNLEPLCRQGHLAVTAEQRGYGRQPTPEEKRMARLKKRQARYVAPWPLPSGLLPDPLPD